MKVRFVNAMIIFTEIKTRFFEEAKFIFFTKEVYLFLLLISHSFTLTKTYS